MVKSEKELFDLWKKYIDIPMFRIVPISDYNRIIKEGINPKKDPYKKIKPWVVKLKKIVQNLEDKGFIMYFKWGNKEVSSTCALKVTINDFSIGCVDFAPDKEAIPYYLALKGGAATANLKNIIRRIKENNIPLPRADQKVLDKIEAWVNKRICDNVAFYVKGSSKSFENAWFQRRKKSKAKKRRKINTKFYLESPFGRFEHFKEIIKKNGLKKYFYYLKNKTFYLRVKTKIPKEDILILKKF